MEVPRPLAYLLAWGIATALTVGASWLGIRSVLSAAAPPRTRPLSAAELRQVAPTHSVTESLASPSGTPTARPGATPTATGGSGGATPVTTVPSTDWQTEPDGRGGTAYRRTFAMAGGDAVVWVAAGEIRVVSAAARPGYTIDIDRPTGDSTTVAFVLGARRSLIFATWRSGPYAETSEGTG
jgi:hypothetical protein